MTDNPIIIAVSGKKQSGKSSLCDFLEAWFYLKHLDKEVADKLKFTQKEDGTITWQKEDWDGSIKDVPSPLTSVVPKPYSKVYAFADDIKQFAVNVLGLQREQCYGTDLQKNSPTRYSWDSLPLAIRQKNKIGKQPKEKMAGCFRRGKMTAREVLKIVGTDIFRKMFSESIWVDATMRKIAQESYEIAFIGDTRFESEIQPVIDSGGYIIRLTKSISDDNHDSETNLDDYDWKKLGDKAIVIDNSNLDMHQKNEAALDFLVGILNKEVEKKSN